MKFLLILASTAMLVSAQDGGYSYDVRSNAPSSVRQGASATTGFVNQPPVPAFSQPLQQQNVGHQNTGNGYRPFAPALSRHVVQQIQQIQHQQQHQQPLTRPSPGIQRPIQPQQSNFIGATSGFSQVQQQHSSGLVSQDISAQFQSAPTFVPKIQEPSFSMSPALSRPSLGAQQIPQAQQSVSSINDNGLRTPSEGAEDSYARPPNTPVGPYYSGPTPEPIIRKHVSVHFAADEPQEQQQNRPALPPPAQEKHYKILFIKAPTYQTIQSQDIPQFAPPPEQKTLVYVLLKKPESLRQQLAIATPAPTKPSKPEVFFIRYKTPEGPTTAPIYGPPDGASGIPIGETADETN